MSSENNKVVYLHKDAEGVVKYVGSGTRGRAYSTHANSNRGKKYAEFVENNGKLMVEIVAEGLIKAEVEDLERELYDKYTETTLNVRRPNSVKEMSKGTFEEYLYYDETSKSCLRWKIDRVGANGSIKMKANSEAGCFNKSSGYYQVNLQGKNYQAHRIVCVLHDLEVNGMVIDHKDRDKTNNKIYNLRVVSQKENCQNSSISLRNTTGIQGVFYLKRDNAWIVTWREGGKQKRKYFTISKYLSSEEAFAEACEYRQQMTDQHYSKD